MSSNLPSKKKVRAFQALLIGAIVAAWQISAAASPRLEFLLGTPRSIMGELWHMAVHERLYAHVAITGGEALLGMLFGTTMGCAGGVLLWCTPVGARVTRPLIFAIGAFPVLAVAPLMIVWFGIGFWMKVALATFATVFVAFNQAYRGATRVEEEYVDILRAMQVPKLIVLQKIVVPGSIEWLFSSMRLNVGFGLLGAFIGEFIASSAGLGYLILRASSLYNVPRAMAAACCIIALAVILDCAAAAVEFHRRRIVELIGVPRLLWTRGRRAKCDRHTS